MAIDKKTQQRVYEKAIEDGRELVKENGDPLDSALSLFTKKHAKEIERSNNVELMMFVSNYLDGLEDGVRSQVSREKTAFKKWLDDV